MAKILKTEGDLEDFLQKAAENPENQKIMNLEKFKETETKEYQFTLEYKEGNRMLDQVVFITFKDGVFHECDFAFGGKYTRDQWKILVQIEAKITEIEESLRKPIYIRCDSDMVTVDLLQPMHGGIVRPEDAGWRLSKKAPNG